MASRKKKFNENEDNNENNSQKVEHATPSIEKHGKITRTMVAATTETATAAAENARKAAAATGRARKVVFNTTELLDNILIYLPALDIHRLRRVSRKFHDLIKDSPKIQEKLFVRLIEPDTKVWATRESENTSSRGLPLRSPKAWPVHPAYPPNSRKNGGVVLVDGHWIYTPRSNDCIYLRPVTLNPVYIPKLRQHELPQLIILYNSRANFPLKHLLKPVENFLSNTYLTDPPSHEASLYFTWSSLSPSRTRASGYYECFIRTPFDRPLKIYDIYEALQMGCGTIGISYAPQKPGAREPVISMERLGNFMTRMEKKGFGDLRVEGEVEVRLFGVLVPDEKEWEEYDGVDVGPIGKGSR